MLGVRVQALSIAALNGLIARAVSEGSRIVIANHNLHSVYLYHRDEPMRRFYAAADYAHVDGMALVGLGRLLGHPLGREHRVTYVDWIRPLCREAATRGWRVFHLGSRPEVAERGAEVLRRELPTLELTTHHGFFDSSPDGAENRGVLDRIADFGANVLLVGMGMPRQERWILENLDRIRANAILPSGACMDYVAGAAPTPPRWMGRSGLEWLHRLASDPRRLASRYLWEPWFLLPLAARDVLSAHSRRDGGSSS